MTADQGLGPCSGMGMAKSELKVGWWDPFPGCNRDHQDYEPCLGSGIPITKPFICHYYWEGGQPKLKDVYISFHSRMPVYILQ